MESEPIHWLDWDAVHWERGKNLPHLQQRGAVYFITFRLGDALPQDKLAQWKAELGRWDMANPPPHNWAQARCRRQLYVARMEKYLDAGAGSCLLRNAAAREPIVATLTHDDGAVYRLGQYVVMPNHVHVLAQMKPGAKLRNVCEQWKSVSAHGINAVVGRRGRLWQVEPFDHIVRSAEQFRDCERYIRDNPRFLAAGEYTLGGGSLTI